MYAKDVLISFDGQTIGSLIGANLSYSNNQTRRLFADGAVTVLGYGNAVNPYPFDKDEKLGLINYNDNAWEFMHRTMRIGKKNFIVVQAGVISVR